MLLNFSSSADSEEIEVGEPICLLVSSADRSETRKVSRKIAAKIGPVFIVWDRDKMLRVYKPNFVFE